MFLGCVELLLTLPLSVVDIILSTTSPSPISFYPGWTSVHRDFSTIPIITADEWRSDTWQTMCVELDLWISCFTATLLFATFGLTADARNAYRHLFRKGMELLGLREQHHPLFSPMRLEENEVKHEE